MRELLAALSLGAMAVGCCGLCGGTEVKLAENGVAKAKIVIPKDPDRVVRFGAQDLQWHLREMTGAQFEIVTDDQPQTGYEIRIGFTARTKARKADYAFQEYVVSIGEDAIELAGFDREKKANCSLVITPEKGVRMAGAPDMYEPQGSMYAVYEFLEKDCGVRWIDPSECGTAVPHAPDLSVRTRTARGKPFMAYRGGTIDWFHDGGICWKRDSDGYKAYARAAWKDDASRRNACKLFLLRHRAGGDRAPANHSFYWCYSRFWNEKDKVFIEKRPEYFAKGYTGDRPPQMCYSDPGFIRQTIEDVRAYFDHGGYTNSYPNVSRGFAWGENCYCLEPMDNGSFCKCPRCTAEYEPARDKEASGHSTHFFKFVNAVAKEIKKSHPTKRITTLAYSNHMGLPTGIRMEDNVTVYVCLSANRYPHSNVWDPDPAKRKGVSRQMTTLEQWHAAYPKMPLALWLYNGFPNEFYDNGGCQGFPGYFAHTAEWEYRRFKELNVVGGIFQCGMEDEVDCYLQFGWMLDPDRSADEMLDEYYGAFGPAKKPLLKFYDLVERRHSDPKIRPAGLGLVQASWGRLGTDAVMDELASYVKEAEAALAAGGTAEERRRFELWKLGIWSYMLAGQKAYKTRSAAPYPKWTAPRVAPAGGDPEKVDWTKAAGGPARQYIAGGETESAIRTEAHFCHDGENLYVRLTDFVPTEKLHNYSMINPHDVWEMCIGRQRGEPWRYWASSPDGRLKGLSYGEVNWRRDVPAAETADGHATFHATVRSDVSAPDRWVTTYVFPLAKFLDKPVKPGETIYANFLNVFGPKIDPRASPYAISSLTSYTTVKTMDRTGEILLEK